MNTLKTELISSLKGEGFLWKTLGSILITVLAFGAFIFKYASDLEVNLELLQEENSILREKVDQLGNLVQKQESIDHKIIVEDSYCQYFTIKNVCYFTLTIGVVGTLFWFYHPDLFSNIPLEQFDKSTQTEKIQTAVEKITNNVNTKSRFYIDSKDFDD